MTSQLQETGDLDTIPKTLPEKITSFFTNISKNIREKIGKIFNPKAAVLTGEIMATVISPNAIANDNTNTTQVDINNPTKIENIVPSFSNQVKELTDESYEDGINKLFKCIAPGREEKIKAELNNTQQKIENIDEQISDKKGISKYFSLWKKKLSQSNLDSLNKEKQKLEQKLAEINNQTLDIDYGEFLKLRALIYYVNAEIHAKNNNNEQRRLAEKNADTLAMTYNSLTFTLELYYLMLKNKELIPQENITEIKNTLEEILNKDATDTINEICITGAGTHVIGNVAKISKDLRKVEEKIENILTDHRIPYHKERFRAAYKFINIITQPQHEDVTENQNKTTREALETHLNTTPESNNLNPNKNETVIKKLLKAMGFSSKNLNDIFAEQKDALIDVLGKFDAENQNIIMKKLAEFAKSLTEHTPYIAFGQQLAKYKGLLQDYRTKEDMFGSIYKNNQIGDLTEKLNNLEEAFKIGNEEEIERLGKEILIDLKNIAELTEKAVEEIQIERGKLNANKEIIDEHEKLLWKILEILAGLLGSVILIYQSIKFGNKIHQKSEQKKALSSELTDNITEKDLTYIKDNMKKLVEKYPLLKLDKRKNFIKYVYNAYNEKYPDNPMSSGEIKNALFPSIINKTLNLIKGNK